MIWHRYVVHDYLELKWPEHYNFVSWCFKQIIVVIICDVWIIMDSILGTQNGIVFLVNNRRIRSYC